jgi:polysaccharide export outer membrane protein
MERRRRVTGVGLVAYAVLGACAVAAQQRSTSRDAPTPTPPQGPAATVPQRPIEVPDSYRIGPGDLLTMTVFGLPELGQAVRVSNSGKAHFSHLGILVVAGKTAPELRAQIHTLLKDKGLVNEPWVTLKVSEVRAHPVYVLGEVMTPGQYQISTEMYLSDLVTLSMGFNEVASPTGFLYRRKAHPATGQFDPATDPDNDQMEAIPVNFRALQAGTDPALNVKLRGGDILYVPERRKEYYFIVGDVRTPGLFELEPGQRSLLLSQALARAGGPTRTAKASKTLLVRYDQKGHREERVLDFGAIMRGKSPDITLQFGDVVFVPGSGAKTAGLAFLGVIPGVVQGRVVQR